MGELGQLCFQSTIDYSLNNMQPFFVATRSRARAPVKLKFKSRTTTFGSNLQCSSLLLPPSHGRDKTRCTKRLHTREILLKTGRRIRFTAWRAIVFQRYFPCRLRHTFSFDSTCMCFRRQSGIAAGIAAGAFLHKSRGWELQLGVVDPSPARAGAVTQRLAMIGGGIDDGCTSSSMSPCS